jgi:hypothetical protein
MSEITRIYLEDITPQEESATRSFQPFSAAVAISPSAEVCENFFGGIVRICINVDVNSKKVKATGYLAGQRMGKIELTENDVSQEMSANLGGSVKGSAKISVNWAEKKVIAYLSHSYKIIVGFHLKWKTESSEYVLASW